MTVTTACSAQYILAEGPQWNPDDGSVSWVDIEARTIQVAHIDDRGPLTVVRTITLQDRVGCAFPLGDGRFLAGIGSRLGVIDAQDAVRMSRELLGPGRRFNDGIIDPAGRLIVGGMSLDGPPEGNSLLRLELDGSITTIDNDLQLSNGMGFSPDRRTFYLVDSLAHVVYARDYDAETGATGPRRVFARVADAEPDGMAVDGEGNLWVALWRGAGIRRFGPDGADKGDVSVGAPHVTSLCFLGVGRGLALVTTASIALTEAESQSYPDAGRLFFAELGASAPAAFRWAEAPLPV
jgi:sugar lactone lactonase YvrE